MRADSNVRIPLCVRVLSCESYLYHADFIVQIYYADSIVQILSCRFHEAGSMSEFRRANSYVLILLCRFYCVDSIVQILLCRLQDVECYSVARCTLRVWAERREVFARREKRQN